MLNELLMSKVEDMEQILCKSIGTYGLITVMKKKMVNIIQIMMMKMQV
jgi:hypothetical protein